MTNYLKVTLLSASLAAFMLPASAQNSTTTPPPSTTAPAAPPSTATPTPPSSAAQPESGATVNARKNRQQGRISQGLASGQMTAGEAASAEKQENTINHEEQQMKAADGGKLTTADRQQLQQQQNQVSHQIYDDKHNAKTQVADPHSQETKRAERQQDRIAQGVGSGQLTTGESNRLENREASINREAAADREANGGKLTQAEKQQINKQHNSVSKQIYKDKHNANHRK